jgi:hypothetical protein
MNGEGEGSRAGFDVSKGENEREVFGRGGGRDLMMNGVARGLSLTGVGGAAASC